MCMLPGAHVNVVYKVDGGLSVPCRPAVMLPFVAVFFLQPVTDSRKAKNRWYERENLTINTVVCL